MYKYILFRKAMKLTVTVFFGLVLVLLAVSVSGKPRPKTYLVDTVDSKEVEDALVIMRS